MKKSAKVVVLLAGAALVILSGCTGDCRTYRVAGNSMSPLLREGDRIFADESATARADLQDGDVILFRHEDSILIKRILAMPGETISGENRKIVRNSKQVNMYENPVGARLCDKPEDYPYSSAYAPSAAKAAL